MPIYTLIGERVTGQKQPQNHPLSTPPPKILAVPLVWLQTEFIRCYFAVHDICCECSLLLIHIILLSVAVKLSEK